MTLEFFVVGLARTPTPAALARTHGTVTGRSPSCATQGLRRVGPSAGNTRKAESNVSNVRDRAWIGQQESHLFGFLLRKTRQIVPLPEGLLSGVAIC